MHLSDLRKFFKPTQLEWRVAQQGEKNGKPWAKVLVYLSNRAIMGRLDEVCGAQNWKNEYKEGPGGGVLCGLSIKYEDEWITKWDGADNTNIEAVKGGLSDSMKRAAVQWGIGRYLYCVEDNWAQFSDSGKYTTKIGSTYYKWDPPRLPSYLLPDDVE